MFTHGRIQRLGATFNLVLVVLHIERNQHGACTLLSILKTKLGLNLSTAGAQDQGGNGQQNRQEHPTLVTVRFHRVIQSLHVYLPNSPVGS